MEELVHNTDVGVEFKPNTLPEHDGYMKNANPPRKMFSSIDVSKDGENQTEDSKDGGSRILKKVAKNVKGSKKLGYKKA